MLSMNSLQVMVSVCPRVEPSLMTADSECYCLSLSLCGSKSELEQKRNIDRKAWPSKTEHKLWDRSTVNVLGPQKSQTCKECREVA